MSAGNRLLQPLSEQLDAGLRHGSFHDWAELLGRWRQSAPGQALLRAVDARVAAGAAVYPSRVFKAFELTALADTRVVILGQDPYHGAGQAEGLAFSVPVGQRLPPSLRNIFKELQRDLRVALPPTGHGSLEPWARQGVLLLNTSLTVEDGKPGAHARLGWQLLTDAVCHALAADTAPKVFMLWGAHAQAKLPMLHAGGAHRHHLILQSNHPSPLSAARPPLPFIGNGHFGQASRFLAAANAGTGHGPLAWTLGRPAPGAILTGSPEGCPSG